MSEDRLQRATDALRKQVSAPDAGFTERVMAQVRQEPAPRREVRETRVLQFPARWALPLAAAAMLVVWFAGVRYGSKSAAPGAPAVPAVAAANAPGPDTVYVRFEIAAPTARQVHLAGDFNGWEPTVQLVKSADGRWVATVPVAVGVHRYQFVVDDAWMPDPASGGVDDGFGGRNSVVVVGPRGVVRS